LKHSGSETKILPLDDTRVHIGPMMRSPRRLLTGYKQKELGEERTNHYKNYTYHQKNYTLSKKGKRWQEHGFITGYEIETRHSNACLSIYGMGDTLAFVIKGDLPYI
jgi:hypothetical protein